MTDRPSFMARGMTFSAVRRQTPTMTIAAVVLTIFWVFLSNIALPVSSSHSSIRQSRLSLAFFPPAVRLRLGQEETLRNECEQATVGEDGSFVWEPNVSEGYEVATKVFEAIANDNRSSLRIILWFPSLKDDNTLKPLTQVITNNAALLQLSGARSASWPEAPATMMELSWDNDHAELVCRDEEFEGRIQSSVAATEQWVDDTLCRLALCPYTASLQRAAIGLESADVSEGPIVVRHSSLSSDYACDPAVLAYSFWQGVSELATTPEQDVATLLVIGPESYDTDFLSFATVCDELIEPSLQAVGATEIVGRAWFHPLYHAESIRHDTVLPGHALPSSMVEDFVKHYTTDSSSIPSSETIAKANDAVRWTPHATINLLRRSQLTAAKTLEAAAANSKPNAVYPRNALRILDDKTLLNDKE